MLYPCSFEMIAHRDLRQEYDSSNTSTGYVLSAKCAEILIHVTRSPRCWCSAFAGKGRGSQEAPSLWAQEVFLQIPCKHLALVCFFFLFIYFQKYKLKENAFLKAKPLLPGASRCFCGNARYQKKQEKLFSIAFPWPLRGQSSFFLVRSTGMDTTPSVSASVLPSWPGFQQSAEHNSKIYRSSVILENYGCARSHGDGGIA